MKVAIQGEYGSFSHAAAHKLLPTSTVVPCAFSQEVFERLVAGSVAAAVIPIENSLAGSVTEHFDLLLANDVFIHREFLLRIEHCLIAAAGVKFGSLQKVYSHPIALQQCRDFFRENPQILPVPFYDTAGSARHVVGNRLRDAAAIAGRQAAVEYGGRVLRRGLEDDKQNYTRFFLIRKSRRVAADANKTSIAFALHNVAGALFKALSVFASQNISLSKIESRPMRGRPWEYVFYADLLCGEDDAAQKALKHLAGVAEFVKVLGIYPAV